MASEDTEKILASAEENPYTGLSRQPRDVDVSKLSFHTVASEDAAEKVALVDIVFLQGFQKTQRKKGHL
jgi:hypothetical protein